MKTKTIISLIRYIDKLIDKLINHSNLTNSELKSTVKRCNHAFDILDLIMLKHWCNTDRSLLRKELNDYQYNIYNNKEAKIINNKSTYNYLQSDSYFN